MEENRGAEYIIDNLIYLNTINAIAEGGVNADVKAREMKDNYELSTIATTANYVAKRLSDLQADTLEYDEMLESKTFKKAYLMLEDFISKVNSLKQIKINAEKERRQKVSNFLDVRLSKLLTSSKLAKASKVVANECFNIKEELRTLGDVDGMMYHQALSKVLSGHPNAKLILDALKHV